MTTIKPTRPSKAKAKGPKGKRGRKKGLIPFEKMHFSTSFKLIDGERCYVCKLCEDKSKTTRHFRKHLYTHSLGELSCRFCKKGFHNYALFANSHQQPCRYKFWKHEPKTKMKCPECDQKFRSILNIRRHFQEKHKNSTLKNYMCRICKKDFATKHTLFLHWRNHFPDHQTCLQCGEIHSNEEEYNQHLNIHKMKNEEAENDHLCNLCNKGFRRKQQYDQHMQLHGKYQCSNCSTSFNRRAQLLIHSHKVHNIKIKYPYEKRVHKCDTCGKEYPRPGLLEIHYRIHTGEKPEECTVCKQFFRTKKALKKHELTKTHMERAGLGDANRERKYLCPTCGKAYFRQKDLDRHLYTHNPAMQRRYLCPHCDYGAAEPHRLKIHLNLHFNSERRFVCELCGAAFHAKASLKEHTVFKHSDVYNFHCDKCNAKFKHLNGLRRHQDTHLTESKKRHSCPVCNKKFDRLCNMRRHTKNVHKTEVGLPPLRRFVRLEKLDNDIVIPAIPPPKPDKTAQELDRRELHKATQFMDHASVFPRTETATHGSTTTSLPPYAPEVIAVHALETLQEAPLAHHQVSHNQPGSEYEGVPYQAFPSHIHIIPSYDYQGQH